MTVATRPAYLHVPDGAVGNYGDEVADIAELMGRPLDASQRMVVDARTSYRAGGLWLALETLTKMGRQSGKTGGIETPIAFTDLFLWEPDRIAWTAHLFKTCREAFEDHCRLIEGTREFESRVAKIQYANGEESIVLKSGARMDYLARSKGGGRGLGGKRVVLDEALFLTAEQAGSILPILAARPNPQIDYLSSAGRADSDQLHRLTKRGRSGTDQSLVLAEFCAPGSWKDPGCAGGPACAHAVGTAGCALDDPALWAAANPAVASGRVQLSFLEGMRQSLAPAEFGREFLGWDQEAAQIRAALPAPAWRAARDPGSAPAGAVAFGVEVSLDRRTTTVGAFGARSDGWWHGEVVEQLPGTGGAVDRLFDLSRRWAAPVGIDPSSPAASLIEPLREKGVQVVTPTSRVLAATCGQVFDDVTASPPRLYHRGQPVLDDAVSAAGQKVVGDGFRWDRRGEGDIAPLYAVTLARCAHQESPPGMPGVFDL